MPPRGRRVVVPYGAQVAPQGPKAWVLWFLFGLGWISLLLFGLSVIPTFGATIQHILFAMAWPFVLCWWAGTAAGSSTGVPLTKGQKGAWTSNLIMAIIGTVIGAVPGLVAFVYKHYYAFQSIGVAILVYVFLQAYGSAAGDDQTGGTGAEGTSSSDQNGTDAAAPLPAAAAAPAAAAPAAAAAPEDD